ncbi:branched-chain amino acid aminotransferase [Geothrix sp. 21YS21S-4]|uniref:branched-chain amino acid aminotransferase n=1 Tax=Geothrix sp. 21YS21S-4 TaxID=3068889 RepID=UPI003593D005
MSTPTLEIRPSDHPASPEARAQRMTNPGFGRMFTDHMVVVPYREGEGWSQGVLKAYGPIEMDPAASVLHYGQAIFEGFKAYHQPDGGIASFRPEANAKRFNDSARRLAMPELPEGLFVEAATALIRQDRAWVPTAMGESLYLRPLMIATEAALGVRPSNEYLFILMASPSGAYFPAGVKPVTVWISDDYVRAAPGGTGFAKCAGNYAASLVAQRQAKAEGCDQVVWLDAIQREYIEEMGGMNIFFVYQENGETVVVTPELTGTLLPGITRDSLLQLAREQGFRAEERKIGVEEWKKAIAEGRMTEAFACGTAAVITPIGHVKSRRGEWSVNKGETGPVAAKLREVLLNLQHGLAPDTHGWMTRIV